MGDTAVGGWIIFVMDVAGQQSFTTTATTRTHGSHTCTTFSLASFPSLSHETSSTLADPNSSELFKQNIQIAMEHVARVNTLARNALNGMCAQPRTQTHWHSSTHALVRQNAYQAGVNPAQTQDQ